MYSYKPDPTLASSTEEEVLEEKSIETSENADAIEESVVAAEVPLSLLLRRLLRPKSRLDPSRRSSRRLS